MAVTFLMDAINHNPSRINCQWPTWHDSEGTWGRRRLNQSYIEFNPPADLNGPCPAQWNEWLGKKGIRKGSIIRETTTLVNIINKWSNSLLVTKRDWPGALTREGRRGLRMCLKKPQKWLKGGVLNTGIGVNVDTFQKRDISRKVFFLSFQ